MKKLVFVLFIVLLPVCILNAQLAVVDAGVATLLTSTKIENAINWIQTAAHYANTLRMLDSQVQYYKDTAENWAKTLASFTEISDYSSFMDWYNRSLSAEQALLDRAGRQQIQIGRKSYSWHDIDQIGTNLENDLKWYDEFTEEQRKEMWLNLGLTPANYAYVQPYRLKANELTYEALVARDMQDSWAAKNLEQTYMRQKRLAEDQLLDQANKLSDKEVLMMISETLNEQNITLNDIARLQATVLEMQAVENKLNDAPASTPKTMSPMPKNVFMPLH